MAHKSRIEGDGEISFCGAIEMAGVITINFKVVKNGLADLGLKSPIYIPGPVEPQFGAGRYIYFEGFSVDEHGKQHYSKCPYHYCDFSRDGAITIMPDAWEQSTMPPPPFVSFLERIVTNSRRSSGCRSGISPN